MSSAQLVQAPGRQSWLNASTTAAALAVVALLCFVPASTNDFWLQAAVGRLIWTTGEIPRSALFPFTEVRDFPFQAHEWLSSVAFYLLEDGLGHDRLVFVKGLLGLGLFALLYRLAHRQTKSFHASLLLAVAAMVAANYRFWLRPELFALLLAALQLNLLAGYRESGRRAYLAGCVALALLWANLHASAPVALVIAGAFAAGAFVERRPLLPYLACLVAMALALLVNPYGARLFAFAWSVENASFLRSYIYEWTPTLHGPFVGSPGFWAFVAYLALVGAALAAARGRVSATGALLLALFGFLALRTQRHIALFAVVSVYPLSMALAPFASRWERLRVVQAGVPALFVAGVCLLFAWGNLYGGYPYFVPSYRFSPLMVEVLENESLRGNVLNSYSLGGELIYRFYPRLRPAIDSRIDVYGESYVRYLDALNQDQRLFREFVARYDVRYVLLPWQEFDAGLRRMPQLQRDGWHIAFADHKMVLLARR